MSSKVFLKSKTVWGVIIMALPQLLPLFGVDFSADDASALNADMQAIVAAVGGLLALWGRVSAKARLTVT